MLMRKKKQDSWLGPLFVWNLHVSPSPHHVSVMQLDELVCLQCECGCECALQRNGVLSRMGPLLQPELSGCALANHHPILE